MGLSPLCRSLFPEKGGKLFSGAIEARFDRLFADFEDSGCLGMAQFFDGAKEQGLLHASRKARNRAPETFGLLARRYFAMRIGGGVLERVGYDVGHWNCEREEVADRAPARPVAAFVDCDPAEPSPKRAGLLELFECAPGRRKAFLGQVERFIGIAYMAPHEPVDGIAMTPQDLGEGTVPSGAAQGH